MPENQDTEVEIAGKQKLKTQLDRLKEARPDAEPDTSEVAQILNDIATYNISRNQEEAEKYELPSAVVAEDISDELRHLEEFVDSLCDPKQSISEAKKVLNDVLSRDKELDRAHDLSDALLDLRLEALTDIKAAAVKTGLSEEELYALHNLDHDELDKLTKHMLSHNIDVGPGFISRALKVLAKEHYPVKDLFIADFFDAAPKGDMHSMVVPLFALKPGDREIRRYAQGDNYVEIQPSVHGAATIFDKDIWLYAIGQCVASLDSGRRDDFTSKTVVSFPASEFLAATNRRNDGRTYQRLKTALERLRGTTISTNLEIFTPAKDRGNKKKKYSIFGLIESAEFERAEADGRVLNIKITLPLWLYEAICSFYVLTYKREYFRIRKALHRRVYELARKFCGGQTSWAVSIPKLHELTRSQNTARKFRHEMKLLAGSNDLPDYHIRFDPKKDQVKFFNRRPRGAAAYVKDAHLSPE